MLLRKEKASATYKRVHTRGTHFFSHYKFVNCFFFKEGMNKGTDTYSQQSLLHFLLSLQRVASRFVYNSLAVWMYFFSYSFLLLSYSDKQARQ